MCASDHTHAGHFVARTGWPAAGHPGGDLERYSFEVVAARKLWGKETRCPTRIRLSTGLRKTSH